MDSWHLKDYKGSKELMDFQATNEIFYKNKKVDEIDNKTKNAFQSMTASSGLQNSKYSE